MGEPVPPNVPVVKPAEQRAQELDGPRVWTKQVLRDLRIINPQEELNEELVDFLMPRVFNAPMIGEARTIEPPLTYKKFPNRWNGTPDPVQYRPDLPGPQKVLSSGVQSWLVSAGYQKVTSFDLGGLWSVNQVGHEYGDKYLKDVCQAVLGTLGDGYYLVRNNARGDEFSVYSKKASDTNTDALFTRLSQAVHENVFTLDNENIDPVAKRGSISQRETPSVPPEKIVNEKTRQHVLNYLKKTHPSFTNLINNDSPLFGLMRDLIFDPVLGDEVLTNFPNLRLFHDDVDYYNTLASESIASGRPRFIFRYETTGNKYVNDTTHDYEEGNKHLRHCFTQLMNVLKKEGISDWNRVRMLRQGGDFIFDLDLSEEGMPDKGRLQKALQANISHFESAILHNKVPIIPAVAQATVDFKQSLIDGQSVQNDELLPALRKQLQQEAFTAKNQGLRGHYRPNVTLDDGDWFYLTYQFNPRSKRGSYYALEYGITGEDYRRLKDMYIYDRAKEDYVFRPEKIDEFRSVILRSKT